MSTRKLAKELGLLRQRSAGQKKTPVSHQIFSYLIVIDFESTCWNEKNSCSQEIIEFPAVLLNSSTGEIVSEFHTYVQPQEHPVLSEFCTELTGITQMQVEAGIPLRICLSQFSRWLQKLQLQTGAVFPSRQQRCSAPSPSQKLCTFLTWSDWDLGVCLQYECKRKQIHKPEVLNSWIDVRSTYRLFYDRKPKGLNGALQDLGIQFSGREHCGLDDARNTAHLAARMMRDGCLMKITRSLERMPPIKPATGNKTHPTNKKGKSSKTQEENRVPANFLSTSKIPVKPRQFKLCSGNDTKVLRSEETRGSAPVCRSLISPKTVLNSAGTPLWGRSSRMSSDTAGLGTGVSSSKTIGPSSRGNSSSLVMCSTVVGCCSSLPLQNRTSITGTVGLSVEEDAEFMVEAEDRCGSYDNVVLEEDDVSIDATFDGAYVSDFDSGCYVWDEPEELHPPATLRSDVGGKANAEDESGIKETSKSSTTPECRRGHVYELRQDPLSSEPYFAVPQTVIWSSKSNQQKTGAKAILGIQKESGAPSRTSKICPPSSFRPFVPEKTSTPNTAIIRPKSTVRQHRQTPASSFSCYTGRGKQPACSRPSSSASRIVPRNVLSSLSTNTLNSSTPLSVKGGGKITSPLCACGRRAKRLVVSNGGPNHGRGFFCCSVRRSGSGSKIQKGCEFFKWESALMKSRSSAVSSSVSLCQMNSTLGFRPPQGAPPRKSY
ncbi:ERI1 exoribonuclease 2 [Aulostomus maculatus]